MAYLAITLTSKSDKSMNALADYLLDTHSGFVEEAEFFSLPSDMESKEFGSGVAPVLQIFLVRETRRSLLTEFGSMDEITAEVLRDSHRIAKELDLDLELEVSEILEEELQRLRK